MLKLASMSILDLIESKPDFIRRFWEVPPFQGEPDSHLHRISIDAGKLGLSFVYGAALDPDDAVVGCLGEAVERYSSYRPDSRKIRIASWKAFGNQALHPGRLSGYSKAQYKIKEFPYTPFTEKIKVGWIKGIYLAGGKPVWVPTQCVYLASLLPGEVPIFERTSTGLAAGSSIEQAALHGLYEVIEHDAFMITWLNRLSKPIVDMDGHSRLRSIFQRHFARPHLIYTAIDITTDLGIPSYLVMIRQKSGWPYLTIATCTRLDAKEAIVKASIEGLVSRTILLYKRSDFEKMTQGKSITQVFKETELDNRGDAYAEDRFFRYAKFLCQSKKRISSQILPNHSKNDVKKDLDFCLAKLKAKGFDPIMVDITPKAVGRYGLKAVKVLVPGLQPIHFGWRYARLENPRIYEASVAMGYRKRPATQKEIYQIPHPLM